MGMFIFGEVPEEIEIQEPWWHAVRSNTLEAIRKISGNIIAKGTAARPGSGMAGICGLYFRIDLRK